MEETGKDLRTKIRICVQKSSDDDELICALQKKLKRLQDSANGVESTSKDYDVERLNSICELQKNEIRNLEHEKHLGFKTGGAKTTGMGSLTDYDKLARKLDIAIDENKALRITIQHISMVNK